eukprot:5592302-Amphidinium_carterae.1
MPMVLRQLLPKVQNDSDTGDDSGDKDPCQYCPANKASNAQEKGGSCGSLFHVPPGVLPLANGNMDTEVQSAHGIDSLGANQSV